MYKYEEEKSKLFTEEGQIEFLKVRDLTKSYLDKTGAFMVDNIINKIGGDSWFILACLDRLMELNEIKEITDKYTTFGQHRVFIATE